MTDVLRAHAEQQFADELEALERADDRPRPPGWRLSPWAVVAYLLGDAVDGATITPKYIGERRLIAVAVATLATDRALLLLGVPGTAKTWVSEHLSAAISGDSTLLVQGTAGTAEEAIRYGWNYARLIAEGPTAMRHPRARGDPPRREDLPGAAGRRHRGPGPGDSGPRGARLGASAPGVARWLGDIREYFPAPVVQVMQKDALERLDLHQLLLEPELLDAVEPDVNLVGTLLSLNRVIPARTRETARAVVRKVVEELERRLEQRTRAAVTGALDRAPRTLRPRRLADVDWDRTIRANLRHYQPEERTIIAERLIGHGRRRQAIQRDVILCIDQSGSMASSVVYSSVFAAVLAAMRSPRTTSSSSTPPSLI